MHAGDGRLEIDRLSRYFGDRKAVDDVTLEVDPGEIFALLGPNGAGKSTTIKVLTTLLPPTSGTARLGPFDIRQQPAEIRRLIGYVPQLLSADGTLTGYENLLVFAKLYEIPRRERQDRIREALAFMGLGDSADRLVRQYSGGMIRRLEIAQSMMHRPRVLYLDEPTGGLDPIARQAVWERITQLRDAYAMAIFFTTHFMEEADAWCNRLAIMHRGKIAALGTPAALKASLARPDATLDDVFIHYSGDSFDSTGSYRDTARGRRVARRLG